MTREEIELQILKDIEAMEEFENPVVVLFDKGAKLGSILQKEMEIYAIGMGIPYQLEDGRKMFKLSDLDEVFKHFTDKIYVEFVDYSG